MISRICTYHEMVLPNTARWCVRYGVGYSVIWDIYSELFDGCKKSSLMGWATMEMILDANLGEA
jgi:hypothetical protein